MTKRDRIAIVISVIYFVFPFLLGLSMMVEGGKIVSGVLAIAIFSLPLMIYWGYRFIQNDISFLKS